MNKYNTYFNKFAKILIFEEIGHLFLDRKKIKIRQLFLEGGIIR